MKQTVFKELGFPYFILSNLGFLPFRLKRDGTILKNYITHTICVSIYISITVFFLYYINFGAVAFETTAFLNALTLFYLNTLILKSALALLVSIYYQTDMMETCYGVLKLEKAFQIYGVILKYDKLKYIGYTYLLADIVLKYYSFVDVFIKYTALLPAQKLLYPIFMVSDMILTLLKVSFIMCLLFFNKCFLHLNNILQKSTSTLRNINLMFHRSALLHQKLCFLTKQINKIYSMVLLVTLGDSFLLLTIHVFNVLLFHGVHKSKKHFRIPENLSIYWIFQSMATVFALVIPAHLCKNSVSNIT